jgi:hypothetical protein
MCEGHTDSTDLRKICGWVSEGRTFKVFGGSLVQDQLHGLRGARERWKLVEA